MGLKLISCIITLLAVLFHASLTMASWVGPVEILSGTWGKGTAQFGYRLGDSMDYFPEEITVLSDGRIVIIDKVNARWKLYGKMGEYLKYVKSPGVGCYGLGGDKILTLYWDDIYKTGRFGVFDIVQESWTWKDTSKSYPAWDYNVIQSGDNIYIWYGKTGYKYSSQGQLIETLSKKPLALGIEKSSKLQSDGQYLTTVEYENAIYTIKEPAEVNTFNRDTFGNLYTVIGADTNYKYHVYKYSKCGKQLGTVAIPLDNIIRDDNPKSTDEPASVPNIVAEYGEPIVSQIGDVYGWKRSDTAYSILKWTWVDDPNVQTGPDAPTNLTVKPSINGLYLTWSASPNDPGCVTGYEISRSTTSGTGYATVTTVDKGVLKFNDSTAAVGTQYFYKVRAVAGTEYSPYTTEALGKR